MLYTTLEDLLHQMVFQVAENTGSSAKVRSTFDELTGTLFIVSFKNSAKP